MTASAERFFCDAMLGRLARWLRLLGYDASYENQIEDGLLLERCLDEGRVLLTRDRQLMQRRPIARGTLAACLVPDDSIDVQLACVREKFGLEPLPVARCPEDNSSLEVMPREAAREHVPPYVFETQTEFHRCPACARIYWRATHWARIEQVRQRRTA